MRLESLKSNWGWFLGLGIIMVILGMIAIGVPAAVSVVWVYFFGILLLVGGGMEVAEAIFSGRWNGFFLHLLGATLYLIVGLMIVADPLQAAIGLTLLLAALFLIGGIIRIVMALQTRWYPDWGWRLFGGVINVILAIMIFKIAKHDLLDITWVIGLFIGIDLIFNGWSMIMIAIAAKSYMPTQGKMPEGQGS